MEHAPSHPSGPGLHRARSTLTGSGRLRVVPWQGNPYVALIGPTSSGRLPTMEDIARCLHTLTDLGVGKAVTPALSPSDAHPFAEAGFSLHERLHLLAYSIVEEPATAGPLPDRVRLHAGRPWHRDAVVQIDSLAFEPFWQFDRRALHEARKATPSHRFRVASNKRDILGYAVTGRAGRRGYLQRLAVAPTAAGSGIGTALVADSLHWLHQRGVRTAMVNTQERNSRAFELYKHLGYQPQPDGLRVLSWTADSSGGDALEYL